MVLHQQFRGVSFSSAEFTEDFWCCCFGLFDCYFLYSDWNELKSQCSFDLNFLIKMSNIFHKLSGHLYFFSWELHANSFIHLSFGLFGAVGIFWVLCIKHLVLIPCLKNSSHVFFPFCNQLLHFVNCIFFGQFCNLIKYDLLTVRYYFLYYKVSI